MEIDRWRVAIAAGWITVAIGCRRDAVREAHESTNRNSPSIPEPTPPSIPVRPIESPRGGGPVHLSDGDIVAIVSAMNRSEAQEGQLARTRARSVDVRQFADHMATQHQQMLQQESIMLGRTGLAPVDNATSRRMTEEGEGALLALHGMTGADFDRLYIDGQIRQHEQALRTIDTQLLPNVQNQQLRTLLDDARATVQQHLDDARHIAASIAESRARANEATAQ